MRAFIKSFVPNLWSFFQIETPIVLKELVELVPRAAVNYFGSVILIQFEVVNISIAQISNGSGVMAEIHLRRMFMFHLANTYFPTACLMIIVEMTLFIDDSNFDTNVMVSLTTLLVMYTLFQSISGTLPKTAYLKLIDTWLLFSLILPFIIFIVHIAWELEKTKIIKANPLKIASKVWGMEMPNKKPGKNNAKMAVKVLVPLATVVFILGYCAYAYSIYREM